MHHLLGWYLDQVLPREFGVARHPLFMFQKGVKVGKRYVQEFIFQVVLCTFDDTVLVKFLSSLTLSPYLLPSSPRSSLFLSTGEWCCGDPRQESCRDEGRY